MVSTGPLRVWCRIGHQAFSSRSFTCWKSSTASKCSVSLRSGKFEGQVKARKPSNHSRAILAVWQEALPCCRKHHGHKEVYLVWANGYVGGKITSTWVVCISRKKWRKFLSYYSVRFYGVTRGGGAFILMANFWHAENNICVCENRKWTCPSWCVLDV